MSNRPLSHPWTPAWRRAGLALAALTIAASAAAQVRSIDVAYDGEKYVVKAQMFAPVPQATAWAVLTDFDNMASWVPNVRDSHVVKPGDKQMTIEQNGTAKLGPLSLPYTSLREIVVDPKTTIQSTQVKGSMKRQQSLMTLSAADGGTKMVYQLEIVPSLLVSTVISEDLLKHDIEEEFTAIIGEMNRRKKSDQP